MERPKPTPRYLPKDVMKLLDSHLQANGYSAVDERKLAAELRSSEVAHEVRTLLQTINDAAS